MSSDLNNSDFSYSFSETRIREARNTSNNSDFSYSLLFFSFFFGTVHVFIFIGTVHFFYQFFYFIFFPTVHDFFLDVEQTLNYNMKFEERKKNETKIARIKIEDLI